MNSNSLKYKIIKKILKNNHVLFTKIFFYNSMGYKLNLNNPKTYNEKIMWTKLRYYDPLYEKCSDKIEVRDYVKNKGLERNLTKLYGVYNSIDEIKIDELPQKCAIKTTHGNGCTYIVKDKNTIDEKELSEQINNSLQKNQYDESLEWQYKNLKPRIMVEELIETDKQQMIDYKFFCFEGKVKYIYIAQGIIDRPMDYYIDFYDENWNYINVRRKNHKSYGPIEKPKKFEEMKQIAEILSKDVQVKVVNSSHYVTGAVSW